MQLTTSVLARQTCKSLPAACLFSDWGPIVSHQQGTGQWFNIFPKLAVGISGPSLFSVLLGYDILLILFSAPWQVCLLWPKSAVYHCSKKGKLDPGLHLQGHYWQRWRCDHPTLLSACQAAPGVLCSRLVATIQETHIQTGAHESRNTYMDWRESKGEPRRWSKGWKTHPVRKEEFSIFYLEKGNLITVFQYLKGSYKGDRSSYFTGEEKGKWVQVAPGEASSWYKKEFFFSENNPEQFQGRIPISGGFQEVTGQGAR